MYKPIRYYWKKETQLIGEHSLVLDEIFINAVMD